jgi:protein-S-isoprenylcysteine O-methyltransferase Ste14
LIKTGPYRYLRHPIYTGLLMMYAGLTVATGEWLGIIGLVVAVVAYWRKTRLEEATLGGAFGAEYDTYRADTWAIVPGIF